VRDVVLGLGFLTLVLAVLAGIEVWTESVHCDETGRALRLPSRYSLWSGCGVKTEDGWVPIDELGVTD